METSNGLSGYGEMFLESNDTDISKTSDSNMNDDILDEYIPSNDSTNPSSQEGQVVKFETKQIEMPNGSESKDAMDDTFYCSVGHKNRHSSLLSQESPLPEEIYLL